MGSLESFDAFEEKLPMVSVVVTVKNEERTISSVIDSLLDLDYPRYEVIVVDGGSEDHTVSMAKRAGVKVIEIKDSAPSQGRNVGVKVSSGNIIAFVDGDCYVTRDWLRNAVFLLRRKEVGGVGGPTISSKRGLYLSRALLDIQSSFFANAGSTVFARYKKTGEVKNIPSCNAVYRRNVLEKAGLFSEDLRFCEDVDLNHRIRKLGYDIVYSTDVVVEHDWKVNSFKSLFRYMLNYGVGRAMAAKQRHFLFSPLYAVPSIALLLFSLFLLLSFVFGGSFLYITGFLLFLYIVMIFLSTLVVAYRFRNIGLVVLAPVAYVTVQAGYAIGFILGMVKREVCPNYSRQC